MTTCPCSYVAPAGATEVQVVAISFEQKLGEITSSQLHRWLQRPEVVRRNAQIHAMAHSNGEIP